MTGLDQISAQATSITQQFARRLASVRKPEARDLSEMAAQLTTGDEWYADYEDQLPFYQGQYDGSIRDFETQEDLDYWESELDPPTLGALVRG